MAPVGEAGGVGEIDPEGAFQALREGGAILIDVRTRAEWSFVGAPDLSGTGADLAMIEWQGFPTMAVNPDFPQNAVDATRRAGAQTAYFICRSGARSLRAAYATAEAAAAAGVALTCVNVAEGFEGDLDATGRRGLLNGWKARGLPWRQS